MFCIVKNKIITLCFSHLVHFRLISKLCKAMKDNLYSRQLQIIIYALYNLDITNNFVNFIIDISRKRYSKAKYFF